MLSREGDYPSSGSPVKCIHSHESFLAAVDRVGVACLALWVAPVFAVAAIFGGSSLFVQQGLFFGEAALVTFGGAYAVLAYVAQRAVESFHWLSPGEMLDGLALAETTPGPLIMVVQYALLIAAFRHPGGLSPYASGVLGALLTTWVTFVPCFLWIFLGAPYVEALRSNRALNAALSAITAAVVGVILNLSVWFAVHMSSTRCSRKPWADARRRSGVAERRSRRAGAHGRFARLDAALQNRHGLDLARERHARRRVDVPARVCGLAARLKHGRR